MYVSDRMQTVILYLYQKLISGSAKSQVVTLIFDGLYYKECRQGLCCIIRQEPLSVVYRSLFERRSRYAIQIQEGLRYLARVPSTRPTSNDWGIL